MSFIFQTIGIAGLKVMSGQWKMSSPNDDFSVASHVDRACTLILKFNRQMLPCKTINFCLFTKIQKQLRKD